MAAHLHDVARGAADQARADSLEPRELRADEEKNRADVEVSLRRTAGKFVKSDVDMADIEKVANRELHIDLTGKLIALQAPLEKSKAIYGARARDAARAQRVR